MTAMFLKIPRLVPDSGFPHTLSKESSELPVLAATLPGRIRGADGGGTLKSGDLLLAKRDSSWLQAGFELGRSNLLHACDKCVLHEAMLLLLPHYPRAENSPTQRR